MSIKSYEWVKEIEEKDKEIFLKYNIILMRDEEIKALQTKMLGIDAENTDFMKQNQGLMIEIKALKEEIKRLKK